MSAEELKALKEELKREILEEMNQKPYQKSALVLQDVRRKYIDLKTGLLQKSYGTSQTYKIWDTIRKLTTLMLGKNRISDLEENEVDAAIHIATDLCEYVLSAK